jgi:hypothetical protein
MAGETVGMTKDAADPTRRSAPLDAACVQIAPRPRVAPARTRRLPPAPIMSILTWIGIALCLSQSALFSGMNLGLYSIGTLPLEVEARRGSADAERVLALRRNGNFALATILWGIVGAKWALDGWLGGEESRWYREPDLRRVIELHMEAAGTDIARVEGQGALNFLDIDEVRSTPRASRSPPAVYCRWRSMAGAPSSLRSRRTRTIRSCRRIVTGTDVLGRLLRGIARPTAATPVTAE